MKNTTIIQNNNEVIVGGKKIPLPNRTIGNDVTVVNEKVYVNGYEYIDGKWKRTLKALWYKLF